MPDGSCLDNRGMIIKVIKLNLQCFIHAYVQATCKIDPDLETFGDSPGSKMYLHTKYGMLP